MSRVMSDDGDNGINTMERGSAPHPAIRKFGTDLVGNVLSNDAPKNLNLASGVIKKSLSQRKKRVTVSAFKSPQASAYRRGLSSSGVSSPYVKSGTKSKSVPSSNAPSSRTEIPIYNEPPSITKPDKTNGSRGYEKTPSPSVTKSYRRSTTKSHPGVVKNVSLAGVSGGGSTKQTLPPPAPLYLPPTPSPSSTRSSINRTMRTSTSKRTTSKLSPSPSNTEYAVHFTPGPIGMKLEPVTTSHSGTQKQLGCRVVQFVDCVGSSSDEDSKIPSQAKRSGKIRTGDVLAAIDGIMVLSKPYEEIVKLLKRPPREGTRRTITFRCMQSDKPTGVRSAMLGRYRDRTLMENDRSKSVPLKKRVTEVNNGNDLESRKTTPSPLQHHPSSNSRYSGRMTDSSSANPYYTAKSTLPTREPRREPNIDGIKSLRVDMEAEVSRDEVILDAVNVSIKSNVTGPMSPSSPKQSNFNNLSLLSPSAVHSLTTSTNRNDLSYSSFSSDASQPPVPFSTLFEKILKEALPLKTALSTTGRRLGECLLGISLEEFEDAVRLKQKLLEELSIARRMIVNSGRVQTQTPTQNYVEGNATITTVECNSNSGDEEERRSARELLLLELQNQRELHEAFVAESLRIQRELRTKVESSLKVARAAELAKNSAECDLKDLKEELIFSTNQAESLKFQLGRALEEIQIAKSEREDDECQREQEESLRNLVNDRERDEEVDSLSAQVRQLRSQLERKRQTEENLKILQASNARLEDQVSVLQDTLVRNKLVNDTQKGDITQLRQIADDLDTENEQIQVERASLCERVNKLQGEVSLSFKNLDEKEDQLTNQFQEKMRQSKVKLNDLNSILGEKDESLKSIIHERDLMLSEKKQMEGTLHVTSETLTNERSITSKTIDDLKSQIKHNAQNTQAAEAANVRQLRGIERKLSNAENCVVALQFKLDGAEREYSNVLKHESEDSKMLTERLEIRLEESYKAMEVLQKKLDNIEFVWKEREEELIRQSDEMKELVRELEELQTKHEEEWKAEKEVLLIELDENSSLFQELELHAEQAELARKDLQEQGEEMMNQLTSKDDSLCQMNNQLNRAESRIINELDKMTKSFQEMETLSKETDAARKETENQLQAVTQELSCNLQLNDELSSSEARIQTKLTETRNRFSQSLTKVKRKYESELCALRKRTGRLSKENDELKTRKQTQVDDMLHQVEVFQTMLRTQKETMDEEHGVMKERDREFGTVLSEKEKKVEDLTREIGEVMDEIEEMRRTVMEREDRIAVQDAKIDEVNEDSARSEKRAQDAMLVVYTREQTIEALKKDLRNLERDMESIREDRKKLQNEVDRMVKMKADTIEMMSKDTATLKELLESQKAENFKAKKDVEEAEGRAFQALNMVDDREKIIELMRTDLEDKDENLRESEEQHENEMDVKCTLFKEALREAETRINSMQKTSGEQVKFLTTANKRLADEVKELQKKHNEKDSQMDVMKNEFDVKCMVITESAKGSESNVSSLNSMVITLMKEIDEHKQDAEATTVELRTMREQVTELESNIVVQKKEHKEEKKQLKDQCIKDVTENMESKVSRLSQEVSERESTLKCLHKQIAELHDNQQRKDSRMEEKCNVLINSANTHKEEIERVQVVLSSKSNEIRYLMGQIETFANEVAELKSSQKEKDFGLEAVKQELGIKYMFLQNSASDAANRHKDTVSMLEASLQENSEVMLTLTEHVEDITNTSECKVSALNSTVEKLNKEIDLLREELKERTAEMDTMKVRTKKLDTEIITQQNNHDAEKVKLKDQYVLLMDENDNAESQVSDLLQKINDQESTINSSVRKIADLRNEVEQKDIRVNVLKKEMDEKCNAISVRTDKRKEDIQKLQVVINSKTSEIQYLMGQVDHSRNEVAVVKSSQIEKDAEFEGVKQELESRCVMLENNVNEAKNSHKSIAIEMQTDLREKASTIDDLTERINDLINTVSTLELNEEEKNRVAESVTIELEAKLEHFTIAAKEAGDRASAAINLAGDRKRANELMSVDLENRSDEIHSLKDEVSSLQRDISDLEFSLEQKDFEREESDERYTAAVKDSNSKTRLETMIEDQHTMIDVLEADIEKKINDIESYAKKVTKLKKTISQQKSVMEATEEHHAAVRMDLDLRCRRLQGGANEAKKEANTAMTRFLSAESSIDDLKKMLSHKTSEVNKLNHQTNDLRSKAAGMKSKLGETDREESSTRKELERIECKYKDMKHSKKKAENETKSTAIMLQDCQLSVTNLRSDLDDKSMILETLTNQIHGLKSKISLLEDNIKQSEAAGKDNETKCINLSSAAKEEGDRASAAISLAGDRKRANELLVSDLEEKTHEIESLKCKVLSLGEKIEQLRENIKHKDEMKVETDEICAQLVNSENDTKVKVSNLESLADDQLITIETIEADLETKTIKVDSLSREVVTLKATNNQQELEIKKTMKEKRNLDTKCQALQDKTEYAESRLSEAIASSERLEIDFATKSDEIMLLKTKITSLKKNLSELSIIESEAKSFMQEGEDNRSKLQEFQDDLRDKSNHINTLTDELQILKHRIATLENSERNKDSRFKKLECEFKEVQSKMIKAREIANAQNLTIKRQKDYIKEKVSGPIEDKNQLLLSMGVQIDNLTEELSSCKKTLREKVQYVEDFNQVLRNNKEEKHILKREVTNMQGMLEEAQWRENATQSLPSPDRSESLMKTSGARLLLRIIKKRENVVLGRSFRKWACVSSASKAVSNHVIVAEEMATQLETTREKLLMLKTFFGEEVFQTPSPAHSRANSAAGYTSNQSMLPVSTSSKENTPSIRQYTPLSREYTPSREASQTPRSLNHTLAPKSSSSRKYTPVTTPSPMPSPAPRSLNHTFVSSASSSSRSNACSTVSPQPRSLHKAFSSPSSPSRHRSSSTTTSPTKSPMNSSFWEFSDDSDGDDNNRTPLY